MGEGGCLLRAHLLAWDPAEPEGDGLETAERLGFLLGVSSSTGFWVPQPPFLILGPGILSPCGMQEPEMGG